MANTTKRKGFKHLTVFDRAIVGQKHKEGIIEKIFSVFGTVEEEETKLHQSLTME